MQTPATVEDVGPVERAYRHLIAYVSEAGEERRLPSERTLATKLGVSRQSVRAAFRRLHQSGRIVRVVGSGSFVVTPTQLVAHGDASLPDVAMLDVLEVRHILEPVIAALATSRATNEDFARIRRRLHELRQTAETGNYKKAGYLFWQEVARATRNPLLVAVYHLVIECRAQLGWDSSTGLAADARRHAVQVRLAEQICDALQARDGDRARSLAAERTRNMLMALADPEGAQADLRWTALDV